MFIQKLYSQLILFRNIARPIVDGNKITVFRKSRDVIAVVSWPQPRGFYTTIKIKVCEEPQKKCRLRVVNSEESNMSTLIGSLEADKLYTYVLQIYDNADLVYQSAPAHSTAQGISDHSYS